MTAGEGVEGFHTSIRGASHETTGLPCQDSSGTFIGKGYALAVVSDGHGGSRHFRSREGSRIAVEVTQDTISRCMADGEFMDRIGEDPESTMRHLCNAVIAGWRTAVEGHIAENPLDESEQTLIAENGIDDSDPVKRYGATLVAGVITDAVAFGFQIGDGDLVVIADDGPLRCIPEDEDCFLNRTSSICGSDASMKFRSFTTSAPKGGSVRDPATYAYIPIRPGSVRSMLACTDGLTTSFTSEESFLRYSAPACQSILDGEGLDNLRRNLELRSRSNAMDDVSVAILTRVQRMGIVPRRSARSPKGERNKKAKKKAKKKKAKHRRRH